MSARKIVSMVGTPGCGKTMITQSLIAMAHEMSSGRENLRLAIISTEQLIASEINTSRQFRRRFEECFRSKELLPDDEEINRLVVRDIHRKNHCDIMIFVGFPMTKAQFKCARKNHLFGPRSVFVTLRDSVTAQMERLRDEGIYGLGPKFGLRQDFMEQVLSSLAKKAERQGARHIERTVNGSANALVADLMATVQS